MDFYDTKEYVKIFLYNGRLYIEHENGFCEPLYASMFGEIKPDRRM